MAQPLIYPLVIGQYAPQFGFYLNLIISLLSRKQMAFKLPSLLNFINQR
ncbi:MAG: hypothetical protein OJF59_002445 [Cytophagales bacterium]|nr:MAG: hypothetical protein OJF59_002445 [Cytophagales bacterium]